MGHMVKSFELARYFRQQRDKQCVTKGFAMQLQCLQFRLGTLNQNCPVHVQRLEGHSTLV